MSWEGSEQTSSSQNACAPVRMAGHHWGTGGRGRRAPVSVFGRELKPPLLPTRTSELQRSRLEGSHGAACEVSNSRQAGMRRKEEEDAVVSLTSTRLRGKGRAGRRVAMVRWDGR